MTLPAIPDTEQEVIVHVLDELRRRVDTISGADAAWAELITAGREVNAAQRVVDAAQTRLHEAHKRHRAAQAAWRSLNPKGRTHADSH